MSADAVRNALGKELFESFFVFTIERNFVDKVVSNYAMERARFLESHNKNLDFDSYIENQNFPQDIDKYSILDNNFQDAGVDKCYTYNNLWMLEKDFQKQFNIQLNLNKFNSKGNYRKQQDFWEPTVNTHHKKIIDNYYKINKTFLKWLWLDRYSDKATNGISNKTAQTLYI